MSAFICWGVRHNRSPPERADAAAAAAAAADDDDDEEEEEDDDVGDDDDEDEDDNVEAKNLSPELSCLVRLVNSDVDSVFL
jgi:hypothetical protein